MQVASKESYSDISGTIFLAKKRNVLFFNSQVIFLFIVLDFYKVRVNFNRAVNSRLYFQLWQIFQLVVA